jgi:hypothetical protein
MERCLLAALAVQCGEAVSAAARVDALWGDHSPRTAGKTLLNYVLRVRQHALPDGQDLLVQRHRLLGRACGLVGLGQGTEVAPAQSLFSPCSTVASSPRSICCAKTCSL